MPFAPFLHRIAVAVLALGAAGVWDMVRAAPPAPTGTYRKTCYDIRIDDSGTLTARCRSRDGRLTPTQLEHYDKCAGNIGNIDGRLMCLQRAGLPQGSWTKTCRAARLTGRTLKARCKGRGGKYVDSSIELGRCRSLINKEGVLSCSDADPDIEFFDLPDFRGRALEGRGDRAGLPHGFTASSVRVRRGVWQVCLQADYGGRCKLVRDDVRDLRTLELDNQIASFRRVRDAPLPEGSWRDTCRNAFMMGTVLSAECPDRFGAWQLASIDMRACRNPALGNEDGRLVCEGDGVRMPALAPREEALAAPAGTYLGVCRAPVFDGHMLRAECPAPDGSFEQKILDMRGCRPGQDVAYVDGDLMCGPIVTGKWTKPVPKGSYSRSCRDAAFDGDILRAECKDENGDWRRTSLVTSNCRNIKDIANDKGELKCVVSGVLTPPIPPLRERAGPPPVPAPDPMWSDDEGGRGPLPDEADPPGPLPAGTYRESCRRLTVDRAVLRGECRAENGRWRETSLDLSDCPPDSDIVNYGGKLVCEL